MDSEQHTVKAYDSELSQLDTLVARMGGLAEAQLESAARALVRRDSDLASRVVASDPGIDALEREVHHAAVRLLALRQPVAVDLRVVVASLKVAGDLERMGDYGANIAKRVMALNQIPRVEPVQTVPRMAHLVQRLVHDVVDGMLERDAEKAMAVWRRDDEVDDMYGSFFRELVTYMMEDARQITACTHLMFVAKNIERIGDHCTNIAETVQFMVRGQSFPGARSRTGDSAAPAPGGAETDPGAGG